MDLSPLTYSPSIQRLALCSFQSRTSSFPFNGKNIATGKLLSASHVPKNSQILPTIKLQRPIISCSNIRTNGPISRLNAIQIQDLGDGELHRSNTELEKKNFSNVLWRFVKPPVIITMAICYICVFAGTWIKHPQPIGWSQLLKASGGLIALSSAFCFAAAINQIFDVDIDRINKPNLSPIASGDLPLWSAWLLTAIFAAIGIAIAGILQCIPFAYSIYSLYFVASIYSVPPFNMKWSTLGAIVVMALLVGLLPTLSSSSAARASLGLPSVLSLPTFILATFTTLHASALGIIKDFCDIEGDKEYKVPTVAATIGLRNAAFIANGILLLNYIGGILAALFMPQVFRCSVIIPAHIILALCLVFKAWKLDNVHYKKEESYDFYKFAWNLMSAEYALFIFI